MLAAQARIQTWNAAVNHFRRYTFILRGDRTPAALPRSSGQRSSNAYQLGQ
jgi:hypothetical protein